MVNNRVEGKSTGSKAAKPTQEELLLSQCCPLFGNLSPSTCRVSRGILSISKPRNAVPTGMMQEFSPSLQLPRASCRGNLGLVVVSSMCCKSEHLQERGAVPMTQLCLSPSWLWPLSLPWDVAASPSQPGLKLGLPKICFPPAKPTLCVFQGWILAHRRFCSCILWWRIPWGWGQICSIRSVLEQPTHSSAHAKEKQGGLVWVLWVFYIPSFKLAEGNGKAEFAAALCSPISFSSPSPCWGWGHVPVESSPGTGYPV